MDAKTLNQLWDYAKEKGLDLSDLKECWLKGLITDDEAYNTTAGKIKAYTSK